MIIFVLWHCLRLGGAIFLPWLRRCLLGQSFPAAIHYTNSQPVSYIHTASPPHSSAASVVRLRLRLRLGQGGCGCQDGCGSLSYCHLPHLTGTHSAAARRISTIYIYTYLLYLVPLLTLSWAEGLVTCDGSQRQHFVAATSPILPPGELHRMLYPIFSNKSSVSASAARCGPPPSSSLLAPAMVNINK